MRLMSLMPVLSVLCFLWVLWIFSVSFTFWSLPGANMACRRRAWIPTMSCKCVHACLSKMCARSKIVLQMFALAKEGAPSNAWRIISLMNLMFCMLLWPRRMFLMSLTFCMLFCVSKLCVYHHLAHSFPLPTPRRVASLCADASFAASSFCSRSPGDNPCGAP